MTLKKLRAGLEILARYFDDEDHYHLGAEHDQVYVYATDRPVATEDVASLVALGWFQHEVEVDEDADFGVSDYDPAEGWSAYV